MRQGEEGQEAVIGAKLDVAQIHKALQGGYSRHKCVVGQQHTLGVACSHILPLLVSAQPLCMH